MMSVLRDLSEIIPPPYTLHDPHPITFEAPSRNNEPSELPSHPLYGGEPASIDVSGAPYFAMRPPPPCRPRKMYAYSIVLLPYTRPEEVSPPPAEMGWCTRDVDEQDWNLFLDHLFPYNARTLDTTTTKREKTQLQQESERKRCERVKKIVSEWNEGFFLPRGVSIILRTEAPLVSLATPPLQKKSELGKALYEVVKKQDLATAQLLLTYGADPDYRPSYSPSITSEAIKKGNEDLLQMILERGPDLEARVSCGQTALFMAVSKGKPNMVRLLLKYGAQVNGSQASGEEPPLYLACRKGYTDIVRMLLDTDVDLENKPPGGGTALYKMAEKGDVEMVRLLLSRGAKAETRAPGSSSPMFRAAEKRNHDIVRLLLAHGADVDSISPGGNTALLEIIHKNDIEMVKLLLSNGANVNANAYGGDTPITKASRKGKTEIVRLLLDHSMSAPASV